MSTIKLKYQDVGGVIDVANWPADEFVIYPEGAREKSLVFCPNKPPQKFLLGRHPYLFKHSSHNFPEQYWVEILAYRLGALMGVAVPPAHVAFDSSNGRSGALIEWFLTYPDKPTKVGHIGKWVLKWFPRPSVRNLVEILYVPFPKGPVERYQPGGDVMQRVISDFDRKKGKQHNWEDTSAWCVVLKQHANLQDDWVPYWAKTFAFDALIGNTDRHQDNWGIVWRFQELHKFETRFAPVFDNGTSMGHEISNDRFPSFDNDRLERYVTRGTHHMKWKRRDSERMNHGAFLNRFCQKYPEARNWILTCLDLKFDVVEELIMELTKYNVPVPLTYQRAEFMVKLLRFRHKYLRAALQL
ncbi:MAG: hypothetical protein BMS9Abin02_2013 [Anaerolineae bacterium]|nr:MAG: hypothetical protein BMS9Abin02_2013 [Anaerolineae bacterium]